MSRDFRSNDLVIGKATPIRGRILSYLNQVDALNAGQIHSHWRTAATSWEAWKSKFELCTQLAVCIDSHGDCQRFDFDHPVMYSQVIDVAKNVIGALQSSSSKLAGLVKALEERAA